jgi:TonB family protein
VCAQSAPQPGAQSAAPPPAAPSPVASANADAVRARIERARALAAAHQLGAAAGELESIRKVAADDVLRNVTSVMLMGIYLEDGNYVRAKSLLEEDFQARSSRKDASLRTYFATAGQALNGARQHVARYRSFGINVSDATLPPEAMGDLDRLRSLLERLAAQARQIASERKTYDALALLEDVLGIRVSLARDSEDRATWEGEYARAREELALAQTQIASLGGTPPLQRSAAKPKADVAPTTKELPPNPAEPNVANSSTANQSAGPRVAANHPSPAPPAGTASDSAPENADAKTLSTGLLNTRATKRVVPTYPPIAKSSGVQGVVKVFVTIDETGKVIEVASSEGPTLLRQSAEDAARGWRFSPTVVDGKTVRLSGYIEFTFTL